MGTVGGITWPAEPEPPPTGHPGVVVGRHRQRAVCRTCGAIARPDYAMGGYVSDVPQDPDDDHPDGPVIHFYPFPSVTPDAGDE